jgi:hypothetical protein
MQALHELENALSLYSLSRGDNETYNQGKFISRQYENSVLLKKNITCDCGTLLCKESPEALNSVLTILERTDNTDTSIYDMVEKAVSCGILERLLIQ